MISQLLYLVAAKGHLSESEITFRLRTVEPQNGCDRPNVNFSSNSRTASFRPLPNVASTAKLPRLGDKQPIPALTQSNLIELVSRSVLYR